MKAIVQHRYGSPVDVLKLEETAAPVVTKGTVLIRVRAVGLNRLDCHNITGVPYLLRLGSGLRRPRIPIPGVDVAGQVEAVGEGVTQLQAGDEVFGLCHRACAELACGDGDRLLPKPDGLSFAQAAAVPVAAITALQALRDRGRLQSGQQVLIVGASGGVGTFAVQIAKVLGAEVAGVCSTSNVDLVQSLGADRVIDYTHEDFTRAGQRYDLIVDMVGTHALLDCRRALQPKGRYLVVGAQSGRWLKGPDRFLKALALSPLVSQRLVPFVSKANRQDLLFLSDLIAAGTLTPVIDRSYSLAEAPEAIHYLEQGHARGKVVLTL